MKMRRFVAADMRKAMCTVREALGPDAVILSSKKVAAGMEIVAAIDYDPQDLKAAPSNPCQGLSETPALPTAMSAVPAGPMLQGSRMTDAPHEATMMLMRQELSQLNSLFESQLALLGWERWSRRSPIRASLLKKLLAAGLGTDLSNEILNHMTEPQSTHAGWQEATRQLSEKIQVTDDDVITHGGVIALVGATGVGKTTTIAKLAARFALRHGNRDVALVSSDTFRIGGQDQLQSYAQILGVPVLTAPDAETLSEALSKTRDKKLVMIDTAGMSQRDMRLSEHLATLSGGESLVRSYLVISANVQASGLDDIVRAFNHAPLHGCILTKEDEAVNLGGALTVIARHNLPVAYVADGQRVPEDIRPARADTLVANLIALASETDASGDEDAIAIRAGATAAQARI